ncbi:hypothetical protein ERO13_D11G248800v2 [Gossypium hirsutum]|uniref:Uncharacterized protein n=2 Tax=Gossypium TaxID=3633 RepID=A0A1U8PWA1_GOSHI|nr:uncharacterized protein LOC107963417 [Gossypium hirsutum]KAG4122151.1 hypothetical protein ERO13_D11G248800v2 [Gossypium hirsutum]
MDALERMKADLEKMREEKACMEACLIAVGIELEEKKRVLSEYKAMAEVADGLLGIVNEEDGDNVHIGEDLDEETMKELVEEAMREFTEALVEAQSRGISPAYGRNDGGYEGSFGGDDSEEAGEINGGHSE